MSQLDSQARAELLGEVAAVIEALGRALALISEAYDHLDENAAAQLEGSLFKPVQRAYGRARRAAAEFAKRHGLAAPAPAEASVPLPSSAPRELIERALGELAAADEGIVAMQDRDLYVELSDQQLRLSLAEVRGALEAADRAGRALARTVGR